MIKLLTQEIYLDNIPYMGKIVKRLFQLNLPKERSAFFWGPRKVGKSYWIANNLPHATVINLLETDTFGEYSAQPGLLRERFCKHSGLVVIDEIQKIPLLLDEVHGLITKNDKIQFLLTGSSARKIKRGYGNLLGGRAWKRNMVPLSLLEVDDFDLEAVMKSGLLPPHFLSPNPIEDLRSYISDYLKEEIAAEAMTQEIPAFSDFLRVSALTSSELLNYTNVGREAGVSTKVVRRYFQILEDTYLGYRLLPWTKSKKRRMIETEKFYLFDVGVANYLARRMPVIGSGDFGKSFEHYILMELKAYQAYRNPEMEITFWRTSTNHEVDFLINDREIAIEVKGGNRVHAGDLQGLTALIEDGPVKSACVVSLERQIRHVEKEITIYPWREFIEQLWSDELI